MAIQSVIVRILVSVLMGRYACRTCNAFNMTNEVTSDKKLNRRIIIAIVLSLLHVVTLLRLPGEWVLLTGIIYIATIVYGFISLARIILGKEKKTLRFCLPFIIILVALLAMKFGPFAQIGTSAEMNVG